MIALLFFGGAENAPCIDKGARIAVISKTGDVYMLQIRPITDLKNTDEISDMQLVKMQTIDDAIAEAEREYNAGAPLVDAKEALSSFRRKHLG